MFDLSLITLLANNLWGTLLVALALWVYSRLTHFNSKFPRLPNLLALLVLLSKATMNIFATFSVPETWMRWPELLFSLFVSWLIFSLSFRLILGWFKRSRAKLEFPKITRDFVQLIGFGFITFIVLRVQGDVNLAGLITTSAVLTAVIGLAAQSTLSSLFSGLILQVEQPFTIGDWIRYEDITGRVIGITWKSTQMLTKEHGVLIIPNVEISSRRFVNLSRPSELMQTRIPLTLTADAAPNHVTQLLLHFLKLLDFTLDEPAPSVVVSGFAPNLINYELRFWHNEVAQEGKYKDSVQRQLWYLLKRHHLCMAMDHDSITAKNLSLRAEQKIPLADELKKLPLIQALSATEVAQLASGAALLEFGRDEIVVKQGEAGDSMFLIVSGSCAVQREDHGVKNIVATLSAPQFFGEMSLLTGEARTATVRCLEDCQLLCIEKNDVLGILQQNPPVAEKLAEIVLNRQAQLQQSGTPVSKQSISSKILKFFGLS